MILDYFSLAFSNLKQRGLRSLLTMLGIFIGIAAVVSLITLGQGLQDAITGQFNTLDADKLLVQNSGTGFGPPGSTVVRKLTGDDLELIRSISGVKETVVRLVRVVSFEFNGVRQFSTITNIPLDEAESEIVRDFLNAKIEEGKFLEKTDKGKIVVGSGLIDNDYGRLLRVGSNVLIQNEHFEIVGVLEPSGNFFINNAILMLEDDMAELLDIEDEIDLIVVQIDDENRVVEIAEEIERKLRKDRKQKLGEEDFSVETPLQAVESVNTVLNIVQLIVAGIAAISLLVGGIGIANTMYTSVLERRREIGIMKSVGARNRDILGIFLIESAFLGLVGGFIGAVLGLGLAFGASAAASAALGGALELKATIDFPLIFGAIGFSLLVGMLAGIIPAYQGSRMSPVEALRG